MPEKPRSYEGDYRRIWGLRIKQKILYLKRLKFQRIPYSHSCTIITEFEAICGLKVQFLLKDTMTPSAHPIFNYRSHSATTHQRPIGSLRRASISVMGVSGKYSLSSIYW
jgi:hypothetical protein